MESNNILLINRYVEILGNKRLTLNTICKYKKYISCFLKNTKYPVETILETKVLCYIAINIMEKRMSRYKRANYALAFEIFFKEIMGKNYNLICIVPKIYLYKTPIFLDKHEVNLIINNSFNLKQKTILTLIYLYGLKLDDVINIKYNDFDYNKKTILISKYNKTLLLSNEMIEMLNEYIKCYLPKVWLFEGRNFNKITQRSLQISFKKLLLISKINKDITIQTLRHSYVIHLLEQGIDIKIIQNILGFKNSKSCIIYSQFTKYKLSEIPDLISK